MRIDFSFNTVIMNAMIKVKCIFLCICAFVLSSCESNIIEINEDPEIPSFEGKYVALGNSVTYGKGSASFTSWSDIIKNLLGIKSYEKKAVRGAVASSRNPEELYNLSSQVLQLSGNYDLITLMIGINDCLLGYKIGDIEKEVEMPIEDLDYKQSFSQGFIYNLKLLLKMYPEATIIVVGPPKISYPTEHDLSDYNKAEQQICHYLAIPFVDLSESQYDPYNRSHCVDGIHPTDEGYRLIANYLLPHFVSILGL